MKTITKDKLLVKIYETRPEMGQEAAKDAAEYIITALKEKQELNIIFAAAPSQNEFLESLLSYPIEWNRINAFHMDEYIGLDVAAPQRFGNFLKDHIFGKANFKTVHYLGDKASNSPNAICKEYAELLKNNPTDIVFMGIGENGHIAFNDPHVAFFDDKEVVKIIDLDQACRQQQVNDGCFANIDLVPTQAYTLTIPTLMAAKKLFCIVPAPTKADAIKNTILGEITEACPASILRTHSNATLYCDADSAKYLLNN